MSTLYAYPKGYDRQFDPPTDQQSLYIQAQAAYKPVLSIYGHGNFHLGACERCGVTITNAVLGKVRCTGKGSQHGL
jgi:hypothetical protein